MNVLENGTKFQLKNFKSSETQEIQFTWKDESGQVHDGTTNEEIVNMLIERFYFLQNRSFSSENYTIISNLKQVRRMLAKRINKKTSKYGAKND